MPRHVRMAAPGDITQLLVAVREGERAAMDRLFFRALGETETPAER